LKLLLTELHTSISVSENAEREQKKQDVSTTGGLSTSETSTSMKKNISSLETNDNETNH
jgi:hypothetical protein